MRFVAHCKKLLKSQKYFSRSWYAASSLVASCRDPTASHTIAILQVVIVDYVAWYARSCLQSYLAFEERRCFMNALRDLRADARAN